jgi:hypothetical protein
MGVHILLEAAMSTQSRWIAALLASSALTACAAEAPHGARAATAAPSAVYVTGSRIAQPVDPRTGLPESVAPTQSVTFDEVRDTGRTDVASALRDLLPTVH